MAAREWGKLKPWMFKWPNEKIGRYYKRKLSKARRRKAKMEILGIDYKNSIKQEENCSQKTLFFWPRYNYKQRQ